MNPVLNFNSVTFNYELLDDAYMSFPVYKVYSDVVNPEEKIDRREHHIRDGKDGYAIMKKIWSDRDNHLLSTIEARELTTAEIKMNHPLMLMVKEQRTVGHKLENLTSSGRMFVPGSGVVWFRPLQGQKLSVVD